MVAGIAAMIWVYFQLRDPDSGESPPFSEIIQWGILILTKLYVVVFVHLPRIRQIGMPKSYVVASLIPIVNLFLYMALLFWGKDSWEEMKERYKVS